MPLGKDIFRLSQLDNRERKTFALHFSYSVIEGILAGLIALNEFVFVKSLMGSSYQVSMLFQFATLVFLLLVFFNTFLKRIKNKKRLLRRTALITRLPLLLLFLFPRSPEQLGGDSIYHYIFLAIFLIYFLANPVVFPSINLFLKNNYAHQNFGRLYSIATTAHKVVLMITTFAYGWALDANHYIFVYIFPVAALLGMLSISLLSLIPYQDKSIPDEKRYSVWEGIKQSVNEMKAILIRNVPYRHFQAGFMFYGFGFMSSFTVMILFWEFGLGLNYSSVAFYRNAYNLLAILMLPYFGRLIGRIDPRQFSIVSFLAMALYLFTLILTQYIDSYVVFWDITFYHTMIFYILFHSVFAATMALSWSIGSAYFCTPEEAGMYQSIHLGLTAIRAVFAPVIGVVFYEIWGFTTAFTISIISLLIGSGIMWWSKRRYPLEAIVEK
ncbi:MAG: MFS transporter [Bacteroidales bacterium]|nr:MFS transporter [Bacteroidales bacterium]